MNNIKSVKIYLWIMTNILLFYSNYYKTKDKLKNYKAILNKLSNYKKRGRTKLFKFTTQY